MKHRTIEKSAWLFSEASASRGRLNMPMPGRGKRAPEGAPSPQGRVRRPASCPGRRFPACLAAAAVIACLTGTMQAAASKTPRVSIFQAIDMALESNLGLKQATNSVALQQVALFKNRDSFLPNLNASIAPSLRGGRQFDSVSLSTAPRK